MSVKPRVKVIIDELVLRGFSAADRDAIGAALSQELAQLVRAGNFEALREIGSLPALKTGDISLAPGAKAGRIGTEVARAVHGSLNNPALRKGRA